MAHEIRPPRIIETQRLRLRPPVESDTEAIFEYASDAAVTALMDWRRLTDRLQVRDFLERTRESWRSGTEFTWVMAELDRGYVIGGISLRLRAADADFGYVINSRYWGRGFATEAAAAVVSWAISVPGIVRIWATCDTENHRSMRVLEKVGLVREGLLPGGTLRPNVSEQKRSSYVYGKANDAAARHPDALPIP